MATLESLETQVTALTAAVAAIPAANDTAVLAAIADLKAEIVNKVEGVAPAPVVTPTITASEAQKVSTNTLI